MKNKELGNWSVMGIWNNQLVMGREERKLEPRQHIWASEIGKDHYGRWLRMKGVKPDFGYDDRTLRVFAAGDFFERIVGFVLMTAGLLKHDNKRYEIPADEDHLMVSVKPDFIAGGKPDWDKVKQEIETNPFFTVMPVLKQISEALVKHLQEQNPNGLKDLVYEIKTVNSLVFWAKKHYLQDAYPHHKMQTFTGMKAAGLPEGRRLYISKDDLTAAEFPLFLSDPELNRLWEEDVRLMTKYIREDIEPPKPKDIVFDSRLKKTFQYKTLKYKIKGCYTENWEVKWSNYLPTITGCKSEGEWLKKVAPEKKRLNDELKEALKIKIDKGLVKPEVPKGRGILEEKK